MNKATERFKETVKNYLDSLAERDEYFALSYEQPEKNLDECIEYILTTVKATGAQGFTDEEIFGMAVHYYQETDPGKITKGISCNVVVNHAVELTEEEKAQAKQKALDEITAAEKKKIQERERREKEAAKAKAEAKRKEAEEQGMISLFGEECYAS